MLDELLDDIEEVHYRPADIYSDGRTEQGSVLIERALRLKLKLKR